MSDAPPLGVERISVQAQCTSQRQEKSTRVGCCILWLGAPDRNSLRDTVPNLTAACAPESASRCPLDRAGSAAWHGVRELPVPARWRIKGSALRPGDHPPRDLGP